MSLKRLIYYSAIIGGWSAFLGWLVSEFLLTRGGGGGGRLSVALTCALVGAAIGAGLNLVAGMANAQWKQLIKRIVPGLLAGGVGGGVGGYVGDVLFSGYHLPRAIGWMIMGAGIGVVEGLYERSPAKLRNGLIGGSVGGLVGGFLFDPILALISSNSGMSSRATAFVILGMCIGILIGLVKVAFKEAWLTVLDGYRPGRQLIISEAQVVLGRAEYATLPFMGRSDAELDLEHAKVVRQSGGRFAVEDNHSRQGTRVNNMRVDGPVLLNDGDIIKIGYNTIRFSERHKRSDEAAPAQAYAQPATPPKAVVPPPATPSYVPAPQPVVAPPRPADAPMPKPASAPMAKPVSVAPPPPPAPVSPAAPPKPPAAPPPNPSAAPATTAVVPEGMVLCPSCKRPVPKQQRYCILCDLNF